MDWRSPGVAHRIHGVSSPNPGDSPRAPVPRPFRPPSVRGGFGFPGFHPGLHSRGPSGRRRAGDRSAWSRGCTSDSRGFISESRGFSPGSIPAAIQAAGQGFIPAAFQAAGERAIGRRGPGVAHRIHGVSSPNPGDSPRAPFPRPFRPQESGRFGGRFPGLHLGFPGILPGLQSRGLSGRRRAGVSVAEFPGCTSDSRGFSPGFIPAAFQAAVGARRFRVTGDSPRASFQRPFRPQES